MGGTTVGQTTTPTVFLRRDINCAIRWHLGIRESVARFEPLAWHMHLRPRSLHPRTRRRAVACILRRSLANMSTRSVFANHMSGTS